MTVWKTPAGLAFDSVLDMLKQPHLLIAGSTGSGKSVLINTLIYTALYHSPAAVRFVFIDPKRVELIDYAELPHTLNYSTEPPEIIAALNASLAEMENRYKRMQTARQKQSTETAIYIVIDEFADLMTTSKRETLPQLQRLAQLGRAANIHLIIATQRPTRDIINGQIKVNLDSRIALRCPTPQDSRNIIDRKGAETLPRWGFGYYLTPNGCDLIKIPKTDPADIAARVKFWEDQKPPEPRRRWWKR